MGSAGRQEIRDRAGGIAGERTCSVLRWLEVSIASSAKTRVSRSVKLTTQVELKSNFLHDHVYVWV